MLMRKPAALTREAFPDLQPRRDLCMVLRGLLGFLDDLRTRVKPTRGVLDCLLRHPPKAGRSEDKQGIIADHDHVRDSGQPSRAPGIGALACRADRRLPA